MELREKWPGLEDDRIYKFIVTDNGRNIAAAAQGQDDWTWIACFAHTLQLCISDGRKSVQAVDTLLSRARNIVTHFNHSAVAQNALRKEQIAQGKPEHKLIQMVPTRWNSELYMLKRLVEVRSCISVVLVETDIINLTSLQWKAAEGLIKVLDALEEVTRLASGEHYATLSQVIPCLYSLVTFLKQTSETATGMTKDFADSLYASIKVRFRETLDSDLYLTAMAIDPRYKLIILNDDLIMSDRVTKRILQEIRVCGPCEPEVTTQNTLQLTGGLWDAFESKKVGLNCDQGSEIFKEELDRYVKAGPIQRDSDPLKWWKENSHSFPHLAPLARKYLGIPATEASSERLFSAAGNVATQKRSCLSEEHLEQLVFLHEYLK